jgi:hypothetical protein
MKKLLFLLGIMILSASMAYSQFTFYLIDNFEGGKFPNGSKWWRFGDLKAELAGNATPEAHDQIASSCGEHALNLSGKTTDWYIGGIGTNLGLDASGFSRFQIDVYGVEPWSGKLKIELFDDDNRNYSVEQDPQNNYAPLHDDKWVAEVNIQGKGFTRISVPFSAFRDVNPGIGDDLWNPEKKNGSGGLLQLQLVAITDEQQGKMSFNIDNLLLTY